MAHQNDKAWTNANLMVPYCFLDEESKQQNRDIVLTAIAMQSEMIKIKSPIGAKLVPACATPSGRAKSMRLGGTFAEGRASLGIARRKQGNLAAATAAAFPSKSETAAPAAAAEMAAPAASAAAAKMTAVEPKRSQSVRNPLAALKWGDQ
mgnify:CR=1 FL=1|tara:strand:+ start:67 stop:516 length:450 start_codon:yes stop_codon:yes gene_type:complete